MGLCAIHFVALVNNEKLRSKHLKHEYSLKIVGNLQNTNNKILSGLRVFFFLFMHFSSRSLTFLSEITLALLIVFLFPLSSKRL